MSLRIPAAHSLRAQRRGGSVKKRLLLLLAVVVALVVLAPTIAVYTPLKGQMLRKLVPPSVGSVSAEKVTVGWFTGIAASNIAILDTAGERVVEAERLTLSRSLTGLMADRTNLGTIRLERPVLYATVRSDGSNIEDLLAAVAEEAKKSPADDPSQRSPVYQLQIVEGRLLSHHVHTGEIWEANAIHATVDHPGNGGLGVVAGGEVRHGPASQSSGAGVGKFEVRLSDDKPDSRQLGIKLHDFPLAAVTPWLKRFDPALRLAGLVTGESTSTLPKTQVAGPMWIDALSGNSTGRFATSGFRMAATALGAETLAMQQADLAWKGEVAAGDVAIDSLSLKSDVLIFDVRGKVPATTLTMVADGRAPWYYLATSGDLDAQGRAHLARLSQLMPGLLKIREETTLTEGEVRFTAESVPHNGGQQLTASVVTSPLAGVAKGRPIVWDVPLSLDLMAHRYGETLRLDKIGCKSDFLEFNATGDARQMSVQGNFNLDQLAQRLDQFIDLKDWQLAGQGNLDATWQTDTHGRLTAGGSGTLRDLVVAFRGDTFAQEPELLWQGTVQGNTQLPSLLPRRLTNGQLTLTAGGDDLVVDLVQPIDLATRWVATDWPIKIRTTGNLVSWARRLRPWLNLSAWRLGGKLDLAARGNVRGEPLAVGLVESKITLENLQAISDDWTIAEPRCEWSGDVSWDAETGTLTSRAGQLVSSTLSASLRNWYWTADLRQAQQVGGLAAIRANLARLASLPTRTPGTFPTTQPVGQLVGNVTLQSQQGEMMAMLDMTANNVAVQKLQPGLPGDPPIPTTIWQDPELKIAGALRYNPAADRVKFEGLRTQSQSLLLAASGEIEKLSTARNVSLAGTVDYDLARITPIVAQYVGEGVKLAGREQARFELRGSLAQSDPAPLDWSQRWQGRVIAPWQSANVYGMPIGGGRLAAQLSAGALQIEPLAFAVGQGQFTASPHVRLAPLPRELTLPPGPLLSNVVVTPEVSDEMLKYFVPVLAQATRSEGTFSIHLDATKVPLGEPKKATIAGQLNVQSVRVTPGPATAQLAMLGREIEAIAKGGIAGTLLNREPVTLLSVSDRRIDFWVEQGRVYHQGVEFQVGDVVFRSRGSVGLDETVSVMLELPIQEKWVSRSRHLAGLSGKVLQVPLGGTLTNLQFDKGAVLREATGLLAGEALGGGILGNEINGALNRLLGGDRDK